MVAHELGSPLLAIRGFADMLSTGRLNADTQTQVIDAIRAEVHMLNALVADVQTSAAVERDDFAVHLRLVAVRVLLNDAVASAKTLSGQHPIEVMLPYDQIVLADPERIGQVLRNLLGNAAKYTPAESPIILRATLQGTYMQIEVIDEGPGIHPDDMSRIFEKFGRGHNTLNQMSAGAGLGLYLSRRIVQAHGSDLAVTSVLGRGAAFSFLLEVTIMKRILLVDDHVAVRQALAFLLDQEPDFSVVGQAASLAEARTMLSDVDIALVDLSLPDGHGIALVQHLHTVNPHSRVLVLTASTNRMDYARAIEAGAAGLLHKSVQISEIISAVRRLSQGEFLLQPHAMVELLQLANHHRQQSREAQDALAKLTPREREVLHALAQGLSDKEIAQSLHISHETQRTHVVNVLNKLGVHSRLQALILAIRHGAITIQ